MRPRVWILLLLSLAVTSIAALAIKHDLFVLTDEIYEYFLFDGHEHISLSTLPGMAERTITIIIQRTYR